MKASTKKTMATAGGMAVGAAIGGAAAMFVANKLIPNDPVAQPQGVIPITIDEDDDLEGDDGDLTADAEESEPESAENIFVKNATIPASDAGNHDFIPQV